MKAKSEIVGSISFSSVIILLVFTPVLFLSGLEGQFFRPLGISYMLALLSSLIVIPVLSFLLSFPGLGGESIKYKARSYDMYTKSSAFQQRSVPQPVMRSSRQQLVMFGLSLIYVMFRLVPNISPGVIPGFNPPLMSSPG